ncbi:MAG TPA: NADH-quinone oxidoreductase subunit NuoF [Armatimonadota bacterium]|nr:NADH-quinone oxidoreductase subunit NuoF [Armatimonadota bacterium]
MAHPAETLWVYRNQETQNSHELPVYRASGGYQALERALNELAPAAVLEQVKASGLRGRGGAGFPTGLKWSFVPRETSEPRYLICNADESEPGTFKDRYLMERDPHLVLEGIALASYAIGAAAAFIYVRGELAEAARRLEEAIHQAEAAGYLGERMVGTQTSLKVTVYRGAGAYICGEETALLNSLEGRRGHPRLKPPFPATHGLYQCPTVVNNVETLANVPLIVQNGAEWFRSVGTAKSPGTKVFGVSGRVRHRGNYELAMGTPLSTLVYGCAGGMEDGYQIRAIQPGGSSVPFMTPDQIDCPLDFESVSEAGSLLGCGSVIVVDQTMSIVEACLILARFYHHESCGFCVPCREGTNWMLRILERLVAGQGTAADIDLLYEICGSMLNRCFCPLGDAAAMPVQSAIERFRPEWEHVVRHGVDSVKSNVGATLSGH